MGLTHTAGGNGQKGRLHRYIQESLRSDFSSAAGKPFVPGTGLGIPFLMWGMVTKCVSAEKAAPHPGSPIQTQLAAK
jgi:hypothetical protein